MSAFTFTLHDALSAVEQATGHTPKRNGKDWVCRCPAHDDKNPSLTVSEGDSGKVLMYCHAGCSFEAVAAALGLDRKPDAQSPKNGARRTIATYSYCDADGMEVRQKLRYEPKDFRIRHQGADGQWVYKAGSGAAVLYRLPELRSAIAQGATVFVVEGEKDCDRLAAGGLTVTTNIEGAAKPDQKAKWRPDYTAQLKGAARVVLLPDNDDPGRSHMKAIAAALQGKVGAVQTLELPGLPPKGDVSDWLNQGHAADELRALAESADVGSVQDVGSSVGSAGSSVGSVQDETAQPIDSAGSVGSVGFSGKFSFPRGDSAAKEILLSAIEQLRDDPGAVLTDEAIAAWSDLYSSSVADYERVRALAKKGGARVAEIDRAIGARNKYAAGKNGGARNKSDSSYTDYTSNTDNNLGCENPTLDGENPTLNLHQSCTEPASGGKYGRLVYLKQLGDMEVPALLVASKAAAITANDLFFNRFCYDAETQLWHEYRDCWHPLMNPAPMHKALTRWMNIETEPVGYGPSYQDAILTLVQRADRVPLPESAPDVLPFKNGLLNITTKTLASVTPKNALTWCLPHRYDATADCPTIKNWLRRTVDGDEETVQLLRAILAALLRGGSHLQRFFHFMGRGGTGKGTFFRLASALIGEKNIVSTDLKELEQNRFETASMYGKRLAMITDADKYGGAVNKLKAMTGGDALRLERKHVQQAGTFTFGGLVFIASNESLATTDYTSGLERRRVTIRFDRVATEEEKESWRRLGGEEAVLHSEIPGLVNWCLSMSVSEMERIIQNPPTRVAESNLEAMKFNNPVADWLQECCMGDEGAFTTVGVKEERRDKDDGEVYFLDADIKLYPNYLTWCRRNGRESLSLRRFRATAIDAAKTLGMHVVEARRSSGQGIVGFRLKTPGESFSTIPGKTAEPTNVPPSDKTNATESIPTEIGRTPYDRLNTSSNSGDSSIAALPVQKGEHPATDRVNTLDGDAKGIWNVLRHYQGAETAQRLAGKIGWGLTRTLSAAQVLKARGMATITGDLIKPVHQEVKP